MLLAGLSAWIHTASLIEVTAVTVGAFVTMYAGAALSSLAVTRGLAALGLGGVIDSRAQASGQIRAEIRRAAVAILVFGAYGAAQIVALRAGWVSVVWQAPPTTIAGDLALLFLFNELHFYACHRLLHTRWLYRRVHAVHHRSRVATPWSTYSLHWGEALMLGSVMLTAMLLHDFHVIALLAFPLLSITGNAIGHSNYELSRSPSYSLLAMSRRHARHHSDPRGNFGFLLPYLDRWLGTELPPRRPSRALGTWQKYALGAVVLVLTVAMYTWTNGLASLPSATALPISAMDRAVPFAPWTVWIYVSYPVIFLAAYVLEGREERLKPYLTAVVAINVVSNAVFLLWPTTIDRALYPILDEGVSASLLSAVRQLDRPFNCLPSLHVSAAYLAALLHRGRKTAFWCFTAWATAIAVATLTTKQHYVADVLAGIALALIAHALFLAPSTTKQPTPARGES